MPSSPISLSDKYTATDGRVYLNGNQALVRLLLLQRQRDISSGLNTAGFISGYRGSPLGGFDKSLWQASGLLDEQHIRFVPGINEELAATAVWGTQQTDLYAAGKYDGVFGLWYGKGPGVDRSGDALKHANSAGTQQFGGVLAVAGDDHGCKSSTLAHQSEYAFVDAAIPILHPADLQELIDYGLFGWAMSRFTGGWVCLKVSSELMESSGVVSAVIDRPKITLPKNVLFPPDGPWLRWPDNSAQIEARLHEYKLPAAQAFVRSNGLDRVTHRARAPRVGIVTTGKAYPDVCQALTDLGLVGETAQAIGLTVYKVAMPWPLEPEGVRKFARGLNEILVIEEKRSLIEDQLRSILFAHADSDLRVSGKFDISGRRLIPTTGELSPELISRAIVNRLGIEQQPASAVNRLAFLKNQDKVLLPAADQVGRLPSFCSGCPHNISTKVPAGSRAMAGIGCHTMAVWHADATATYTQMGGEGANWIGHGGYSEQQHVFQNMGDGTYFHSGSMAIRAAVAANVNITYKILFNDAVAMTGGQPMDGVLTPASITQQVYAEGVRRIAVVSDDPEKYTSGDVFAEGVTIHHRREMKSLQEELRQVSGVSVLIYDQMCAAEKRRRRRRDLLPPAKQRVYINEWVCDACGDCTVQSGCMSVMPLETPLGRKRTINQSACNMDYSCMEGFCPSFVSVEGGALRKPPSDRIPDENLPEPVLSASLGDNYNILIAGIGGTGVVTVAALLGTAAHIEGRHVKVLDQTGLAQKFGSVMSHVRIGSKEEEPHTARIPAGSADLLLGCDLVVAGGGESLRRLSAQRSAAVVDTHEEMTAAFLKDRDFRLPGCELREAIAGLTRPGQSFECNATSLAAEYLGDSVSTNLLLLGFAWQRGLVPLREASIRQAIKLNGIAVEENWRAFRLGRIAANSPELLAGSIGAEAHVGTDAVYRQIDIRASYLSDYQDEDYAAAYRRGLAALAGAVESHGDPGAQLLATAADNLFRLMASKDEYEIARLYTETTFLDEIASQFDGDFRFRLHLAPPLIARTDPATGRPRKIAFGAWILPFLKFLSRLKRLRGTWLDVFRYSQERKTDRQLLQEYQVTLEKVVNGLCTENLEAAQQLASWPDCVRGFGPVRTAAVSEARQKYKKLEQTFNVEN